MNRTVPSIVLFESMQVRREWFNDERWFSIVDIVGILTDSSQPSRYRTELKNKMWKYEWYTEIFGKIEQLKFVSSDGKKYQSDGATTQTVLRIIQSIPSPKAEWMKQWLASLGNQRIEEMNDPELGIIRAKQFAIQTYKSRWMTDGEIQDRLQSIETRNEYTDILKASWIQNNEYGIITNINYEWAEMTAKQLKDHKWLWTNDNLRDHMSRKEILLTSLSEVATMDVVKAKDLQWFDPIQQAAKLWARVAKNTRKEIEELTWESLISNTNRLTPKQQALRNKARKQEKLGHNKKKGI